VDPVSLAQEELGQIGAVLTRNTGYESRLLHTTQLLIQLCVRAKLARRRACDLACLQQFRKKRNISGAGAIGTLKAGSAVASVAPIQMRRPI
jgi:hypothetical protein